MSRTIAEIFAELPAALERHMPPLAATFAPPATRDEIQAAEASLQVQFPSDLCEWLQCANGQVIDWSEDDPTSPGPFIIPQLRFGPGEQDFSAWGYWNSVQEVVELTRANWGEPGAHSRDFGGLLVGPVRDHGRFVYLTTAEDPVSLAMDLDPASGGQVGQIVSISDYPGFIACIAPSLTSLLERYLEGYRSGKYHVTELNVLSER